MGDVSPPTAAVKRWKKPRIYLTIAALSMIILAIAFFVPFFLPRSEDDSLGGGGGYAYIFAAMLAAFLYLLLCIASAACLLKKKPYFLFPLGIIIMPIMLFGLFSSVGIPSTFNYCESSSLTLRASCQISIQYSIMNVAFVVFGIVIAALLLKGRSQYLKLSKLR